jgi:hypothetical protein
MKEPSSLDDLEFSGNRFLKGETKRQLDQMFETSVVNTVLAYYKVSKKAAYIWYRERYGEELASCECLPHVIPDFPYQLITCRLKYELKRVTGLSYPSVDKSVLGEAVAAHGADNEFCWLVTEVPFLAGRIVVGKRTFPLECPFDGYVVHGPDKQCYLFCPLQSFLESDYCRKPY